MNRFIVKSLGALAVAASLPAVAQVVTIPQSALNAYGGGLYTSSFGTQMVTTDGGNEANVGAVNGRNDDGFRGPINLGFTLANFFGTDYTQFYLNNNGNITFQNGLAAYTPEGPQGATAPVIAPFFADVDTRGQRSGVVYYNVTPDQVVITWDHVGYFNAHDDKLDTFQLVVRGAGYDVPTGEGTIGFFYGDMNWETGDASGGAGGFDGTPAAIGFGDGQQNGFVLAGSTVDGIAQVVNDKYIWFNINQQGDPTPVSSVPEPETNALMLLGLGALGLAVRRRKQAAS